MTTTLGRPLALAVASVVCDGRGQHSATLVTDGTRLASDDGHVEAYGRNGTVVVGRCLSAMPVLGHPNDPEPCGGYVEVDLADAAVWEPATLDLIDYLDQHGTRVE